MKRTILFFICLLGMTFAFAQTSLQDVVYLNNGSIIRGDIIEMIPNESVKIMTTDGSVFVYPFADVEKFSKEEAINSKQILNNVYNVEKKSPWISGALSLFVPGLGQLYNGENHKGAIDFLTNVGGYVITLTGAIIMETSVDLTSDYYYDVDDGQYMIGLALTLGGACLVYGNLIHSICDAVKSSKRINAENGFVMYQLNGRCAFGMQPSVAYERPQYLQGSKPELSAGMKFKLTF